MTMPSPKDIKNILKATQGTKAAGKAATMEELLGRLPKPTAAQQLEADLMFQRLKEEQAARYAPTNPPTERGKEALRQAQNQLRERGKQKFLEPSAEKRRMYHGTRHYPPGITPFDPTYRPSDEGITTFTPSRSGMTFLSPDPRFANLYSGDPADAAIKSGAVYPAHVQVRNPFDFENADHLDVLTNELSKLSGTSPKVPSWIHAGPEKIRRELRNGSWDAIENPYVIEAAKNLGFDAMYMKEAGIKNLGVFDPKRIKSAIGNVGTYDITNPDITKAEGGRVDDEGNVAADIESMLQRVGAFKDPVTGVSGLTTSAGFSPLEGVDVRGIASLIRGAEPKDIKDLALTIELAKRMGVRLNDKGLSQIYGKLSGDGGLRLGYSPKDKSAHLSYWAPFAEGGEVQHLQVGGIPKLFKTASNVGKAEKSMEAARNLMQANRPLSLAERQFVAEVAARQAEELASLRPRQAASIETKGAKREVPPRPARAKPKTKQQISAVAERVAPQMLGEFVRKPGKTEDILDRSRKQWDIEQELQHDIQRSREVPEAAEISLEPHKDSVMVSLPGDTSISDYDIFGIGGQGLHMPSRQYGGSRFGLAHPEEAGWASGLVPASGFQRLSVNEASQQFGGAPVLAAHMAMGPQGTNYALHYTDALLKSIRPETMKAKDIDAFNRMVRSGTPKNDFLDFPGIEHPEASYLYFAENPAARKHFNALMQLTDTTQALGLPSGLNVRHAITEPAFLNLEPGMTGHSVLQMQPGVTELKPSMHPTYSHDIPGLFLGRTDILYPYEMMFPDTVEMLRSSPAHSQSIFPTIQKTGSYSGRQIIDQQLLDEIGEYRRRIKQLTGKKDGGVVRMAGGNEPGQSIGEMFKPKPLTIPQPLTEIADAVRRQFSKEKRSMSKPGALTDVLMRGPVAFTMGAPMDIIGMGGDILDWAQTKIPGLRTNASVMDTPRSVVDKRPSNTIYEPKFKFGPEPKVHPSLPFDANQYIQTNNPKLRAFIDKRQKEINSSPQFPIVEEARMPYGTAYAQELMNKSGLTTGEERPLFELGTAIAAPGATAKALKYGKAGATALAPTAQDMLQMHLERLSDPTRSYVVKPEGGNWIQGSVEKYLKPFKFQGELTLENYPEWYQGNIENAVSINNFVDKKLSKYMRNEMATPSDSVRIQADEWAGKKTQLLADKQKQIDKARADMEKAQRERNVNPEMLTRSQARIRELEKEKALIENRTGLHYEPPNASFQAELRRKNAKQPASVEAKTESGKKWEDVADASIIGGEYRFQTPLLDNELYTKGSSADRLKAEEDALREIGGEFAVQNPDAIANKMDMGFGNVGLGWDHLTDELSNAMDIATSGLPKSLELTPKTLDKMSVHQAVEHVDKINAWRVSQKAEADAARAANQATVVHKEYPEAGLKWVEIKAPDTSTIELPEGVTRKQSSVTQGGLDVPGIGYIEAKWNPETGLDWAGAEEKAKKFLASKPVEDALKYEGEMLSHCVGGYCPDVIEGRSRIFSLRDEAGRPHATIEVEPEARIGFRQGEGPKTSSEDYELRQEWARGVDRGEISENTTFAEWWRSQNNIPEPVRPERISQIKGLSNKKPQAEFIPYIQDFVRGNTWSKIGDIEHTELKSSINAPWRKRFEEAGVKVPDLFSPQEYENMVRQYFDKTSTPYDPKFMHETYGFPLKADGGAVRMAEGGAVDYEARFNQMLQDHVAGMAEGGAVDYESRFNDMLQKHVQGLAEGGEVENAYNSDPDMSDGGRFVQAPAFANGGAVKSIWTVN